MNVIQHNLIEKLINHLDELIFRGKIKINGEYQNYEIFKTLKEGNMLRKYLYLETEVGNVEEAQLVTSIGEILAVKPFDIQKQEDGLMLAFEFKIEVNEN